MTIAFDYPWLLLIVPILLWLVYRRRQELAHKEFPDRLSALVRVGVLALVILALTGPKIATFISKHYVVFAVDLSESTGASQDPQTLIDFIKASAPADERTSYSVITFGEKPYIESNFAPKPKLPKLQFLTSPPANGTDIAAAIRLALQTFPKDGTKEIVLMTDGRASQGDLDSALAQARAQGVTIHTIPVGLSEKPEFWVDQLSLPEEVALNLPFQILIKVGATQKGSGQLLLYRDHKPILDETVKLERGVTTFDLPDKLEESGSHQYQIVLKPTHDQIADNNKLDAVVRAVGGAEVLLVGSSSEANLPARRLLSEAGYRVEERALENFGLSLAALASYRAVILNDVPLRNLQASQLDALRNYLRDLGGGLFLLQGQRALKEFEDRSIEELLPVTYETPEPSQIPGVALVLVLDRSSSMSERAGSDSKINLLKLAATKGIEILDLRDYAGVVAFDTEMDWIVPLKEIDDKEYYYRKINGLRAGGGTDFYSALESAFAELDKTRSHIKHIMLFTDGKSDKDRPFEAFLGRLEKSSITLSTVAIDTEPDLELLQKLADAGHGKLYEVRDASELPAISLREIRRISRLRWIPGVNAVQASPASQLVRDKELAGLPAVEGYALTYEKPTAESWLRVQSTGDPLLSSWRYGLGQVAVLNTDLEGAGSAQWLKWPSLSKVLGQVMARIYRTSNEDGQLGVYTRIENGHLEITADVQKNHRWEQGLEVAGSLSSSEGDSQPIALKQIAPGRWRGVVENLSPGSHVLKISARSGQEVVGEREKTVTLPYPEELRRIGTDQETLSKIAAQTGGVYLETPKFQPHVGISAVVAYREIWVEVLLLALALFLLDLGLRKIPLRQG
ncbi:VWA domain-containing protein [Candidatus Acetothermia bacterium]|nr:VWA domain-containing protein [Candidatus Acetothermia bacterium]